MSLSGAFSLPSCTSYKMAEDIDSQMKKMAQGLTDVIDQINATNEAQEEDSAVRGVVIGGLWNAS